MSPCPSHRSPARVAHRDRLGALAHLLATGGVVAAEVARADAVLAVGVSDAPGDPRAGCLHLRELVADPVDALVGFVAPAEWWAFGVVAPASLHSLEHGGRGQERRGFRVAHLVSRHGAARAVAVGPEGVELVTGPRAAAPAGRVPDVCRRVLGLATAPPTTGTGALFVTRWLDDALARAIAGDEGHADDLRAGDRLAALAADFDRRWSWDRLRRACAAGEPAVHGMSAGEAAWWDEGGFSRRAFEGYLAPATMLDLLGELRPRAGADRRFPHEGDER
jgi:hypothetical protein